MGGTHWYHPHLHFHTEDQASGGAVGALIIEEQDFAHTIDASDLNNGAAHQVYNFLTNKETDLIILGAYDTDKNQWMNKNQDNDSLIYNLVEHVWYRLRILTVNPEAEPEIITIPPECDAHAISHDGVYRFNPPKHREDKYYLTGASRVDVAIKCSSVGTFVVTATEGWSRRRRLQVSTGPTATGWADGFGDWDGDQPLAVLQVTAGTGTESKHGPFIDNKLEVGTWPSWRPDYLLDLRQDTPENYFSIEMDNASVNDLEYNEQCPLKDSGQDFDYDTLQEWNHLTVDRHPAHVHIWHQQILSNCGPGHDDGEYYDVIGDAGDSDADCKVRLRLMRYCGRETFHCHILKHEDAGTMGWINVKDTSASCRVTPTYPCHISGTVSECINEYDQPNECLPWD
jgi:FtsP/CotA-like multicopper oxidase with cupredoxin domain